VKLFDAGVNLLDPRFDINAIMADSLAHQVDHMLVIASNIEESRRALALKSQYQEHPLTLRVTAGVHPHYADHATAADWKTLNDLLAYESVSAVGECGLDFNRNFSTPNNQIAAFDTQLQIAAEHNKGVYLHEREAFDKQISMLLPMVSKLPFMVSHCFAGNTAQLKSYLDIGCYIGITGWVCDDKRGVDLQQAVKHLPLSKLLLETDAPYLFPKTLRPRAKQNAPKNLHAIAEKVAELKQLPIQQIYQAAYSNASHLFNT
jgi:TatD DNase family protein